MKRLVCGFLVFLLTLMNSLSFPVKAEEVSEIEKVTMDHAISFVGAELNDPIDGMWQCMRENNDNGGALEASPDSIHGDGNILKLDGYQSGGNTQYVYTDMEEFHNKLITTTMVFDGELPNLDASFLSFVFRADSYSSKFYWNTSCYSILLKSGQIEVQKLPSKAQGKDNNLGGTKGRTPIVIKLEEPFKAGKYNIEMGVIDGISPNTGKESVNIIFRMNGVEYVNVWDDSERTPCLMNKGYFMVAPIFTQQDVEDETKTLSRSSVSFYSTKAAGDVEQTINNEKEENVNSNTNDSSLDSKSQDSEKSQLRVIIGVSTIIVVVVIATIIIVYRKKKSKKVN